jgi:hypothetical protein
MLNMPRGAAANEQHVRGLLWLIIACLLLGIAMQCSIALDLPAPVARSASATALLFARRHPRAGPAPPRVVVAAQPPAVGEEEDVLGWLSGLAI